MMGRKNEDKAAAAVERTEINAARELIASFQKNWTDRGPFLGTPAASIDNIRNALTDSIHTEQQLKADLESARASREQLAENCKHYRQRIEDLDAELDSKAEKFQEQHRKLCEVRAQNKELDNLNADLTVRCQNLRTQWQFRKAWAIRWRFAAWVSALGNIALGAAFYLSRL